MRMDAALSEGVDTGAAYLVDQVAERGEAVAIGDPVHESGLAEELDGCVGELEDDLARRVRAEPEPVNLVHQRAELVVAVELLEPLAGWHRNLRHLFPDTPRLREIGIIACRQHVDERMDVLV